MPGCELALERFQAAGGLRERAEATVAAAAAAHIGENRSMVHEPKPTNVPRAGGPAAFAPSVLGAPVMTTDATRDATRDAERAARSALYAGRGAIARATAALGRRPIDATASASPPQPPSPFDDLASRIAQQPALLAPSVPPLPPVQPAA